MELDNWGRRRPRPYLHAEPDKTRAGGGESSALDGHHHVEIWAPLSLMATLTPEQHYWLVLLLSPQGISYYPILKDVLVTPKGKENSATTNETHLLLSFETTSPHSDTLNSSFEQLQRELKNRLEL